LLLAARALNHQLIRRGQEARRRIVSQLLLVEQQTDARSSANQDGGAELIPADQALFKRESSANKTPVEVYRPF
jgi:hypothetical protein